MKKIADTIFKKRALFLFFLRRLYSASKDTIAKEKVFNKIQALNKKTVAQVCTFEYF